MPALRRLTPFILLGAALPAAADEIIGVTVEPARVAPGQSTTIAVQVRNRENASFVCGLVVSLGDGTTREVRVTEKDSPVRITHTYAAAGSVTVSVEGKFQMRGLRMVPACEGGTRTAALAVQADAITGTPPTPKPAAPAGVPPAPAPPAAAAPVPGPRAACGSCPVQVAQAASEQEYARMREVFDRIAVNHAGPTRDQAQWRAAQYDAAVTLARGIALDIRRAGASCESVTEAEARKQLEAAINANVTLARRHTAAQISGTPGLAERAAEGASVLLQMAQHFQPRIRADVRALCNLADIALLQAAIEAHADTAFSNYQISRQLLAAAGATAPQAGAPAGKSKCDRWAEQQGKEWADARVGMPSSPADKGEPRKFRGSLAAGTPSELLIQNAAQPANMILRILPATSIQNQRINIGAEVVGYGRQSGQRDIKLRDGSTSTAAVIDVACIE